MTSNELLDLIAETFRRTCGGLPLNWEEIKEAVLNIDAYDMGYQVGYEVGYQEAQDEVSERGAR